MKKFRHLSVLIDNSDSWFNAYKENLVESLRKYSDKVVFYKNGKDLAHGDILFVLSCTHVLTKQALSFHRHNIVVHASDLPKGKGWSPLAWQVERGVNIIPLTLFEASDACDSGDYYIKDGMSLNGTELIDSLHEKIARKLFEMIELFLSSYPMHAIPQNGTETFYHRRTLSDNKLDVHKTIKSQFNKMRVADNDRYPLFFVMKGKRYILKIYEDS